MKIINKANKLIDLIKTKTVMAFKQKIYTGKKYKIKYVLKTNPDSKDLVVIFTSCTKPGQKARYNYMRTLDEFNCNKLFILDDFGFDSRGAYYLGENKNFAIEDDVQALIDVIIKKSNPHNKVFIGSSKGGYAALYFGLNYSKSMIISGAPQYMLGNYLNYPNHQNILKYIMGDTSSSSIEILNNHLKNKLTKYKDNNCSIYLHYSPNDETYDSDISILINDIKNLNIEAYYDVQSYNNHAELTNYFPIFIKLTLNNILNSNTDHQDKEKVLN